MSRINAAAPIITRTKKYDHIKPVLKQLHWLPVNQRINYKILLLTYKALNGQAFCRKMYALKECALETFCGYLCWSLLLA